MILEVERLFSILKLIKSARHNRLGTGKLEQFMRLNVDGPPLEEVDYDRAIQIFRNDFTNEDCEKKERRFWERVGLFGWDTVVLILL